MSLGERVRQLRQSRGLTQEQLGGRELSKSFISLLERGVANPSIETLLLLARRLGTSVDSLLGQTGRLPDMTAEGLLAMIREARKNGDLDLAEGLLESVEFLSSKFGLEEATRETLLQRGELALERRAFDDAWSRFERAQQLSEHSHDFWRTGRAMVSKGWVKIRQRSFPEAVAVLEQGLMMLRKARASRDPARADALIALGTALGYMRDLPRAIRRFEEASGSAAAQYSHSLRGRALWGLGLAHRMAGNLEAALTHLEDARDAMEKAEELADLMRVLKNIGEILHELGESRAALRYLHQSLQVMQMLKKPVDHASTLTEISRVHLTLGDLDEAARIALGALGEANEVGDQVEIAESKAILASVRLLQNDATGLKLLKEAVLTLRALGLQVKAAEVAGAVGLKLKRQRRYAVAAECLALATEIKN